MVGLLGRLFLLSFGVWPGMLRINKPAKLEPAPVMVVAPHMGALEGFIMMWDGMPRAIAMETYARLPVVYSVFHASGGISVPVPASNDQARRAREQAKVVAAPTDKVSAPSASAVVVDVEAAAEKPAAPPGEKPSTLAVRKAIAAHKKSFDPADPAKCIPLCISPEGTTHNGVAPRGA